MLASEVPLYLHYNPTTGEFRWRVSRGSALSWSLAGTIDKDGRRVIKLFGKRYYDNVLAWAYMRGVWPTQDVDHWDRDRLNCAWINLREVSRSVNCCNKLMSKGGVRQRGSRFQARITRQGKLISLGHFATIDQARAAVEAARSVKEDN